MVTTDRERAEQYVEELYGVTINKKTGQTRAGVRREYWVELFEHIVAAVRAERDAEWSAAAQKAISILDRRAKIREKITDAKTLATVDRIFPTMKECQETIDALNALIEEVKP